MPLIQGTRRLLLFHLGTNQAFREAIVRAESAIFLQQFAAVLLFYKEGKIQATGPYTVGTAVFLARGVFF